MSAEMNLIIWQTAQPLLSYALHIGAAYIPLYFLLRVICPKETR